MSNIYLAAVDLLETVGWCQGEYVSPDGKCCLLGALDTLNAPNAAYEPIEARIGEIWIWNDTPGRTKEEVIALLKDLGNEHLRAS